MFSKSLSCLLIASLLFLVVSQPVLAHDKAEGTVVEVKDGKLTFTPKGKEKTSTYPIAKEVTVKVDGKAGKVSDLKKGYAVTLALGEEHVITSVVAVSKKE